MPVIAAVAVNGDDLPDPKINDEIDDNLRSKITKKKISSHDLTSPTDSLKASFINTDTQKNSKSLKIKKQASLINTFKSDKKSKVSSLLEQGTSFIIGGGEDLNNQPFAALITNRNIKSAEKLELFNKYFDKKALTEHHFEYPGKSFLSLCLKLSEYTLARQLLKVGVPVSQKDLSNISDPSSFELMLIGMIAQQEPDLVHLFFGAGYRCQDDKNAEKMIYSAMRYRQYELSDIMINTYLTNLTGASKKNTLKDMMSYSISANDPELMQLLISKGVTLKRSRSERPPLLSAIMGRHYEAIKFILELDPSQTHIKWKGKYAMDYALSLLDEPTVNLIKSYPFSSIHKAEDSEIEFAPHINQVKKIARLTNKLLDETGWKSLRALKTETETELFVYRPRHMETLTWQEPSVIIQQGKYYPKGIFNIIKKETITENDLELIGKLFSWEEPIMNDSTPYHLLAIINCDKQLFIDFYNRQKDTNFQSGELFKPNKFLRTPLHEVVATGYGATKAYRRNQIKKLDFMCVIHRHSFN